MAIKVKKGRAKTWGKAIVAGKVLGKSRGKEVQEHLETIYYLGWWRVIIYHDFKFIPFN